MPVNRSEQLSFSRGSLDGCAVIIRPAHARHFSFRWVIFLFAILGLSAMTFTTSALAAPLNQDDPETTGEVTFGQVCSACHTIGEGIRVGPDLLGVTDRREGEWLKVHILTPSIHHEQNDSISVANREQYGIQMPDLGLTEPNVEAVITYLETTVTVSSVTPSLYAPTLGAGVLAVILLTILGLYAGRKKVEVRL